MVIVLIYGNFIDVSGACELSFTIRKDSPATLPEA